MLTTLRRDRRTRRRADFNLESLDDRLVLSAGGGGAVAEAVGAGHAIIVHGQDHTQARHHKPAHHHHTHARPAHRGFQPMAPGSVTPVMIGGSMSTSAKASSATGTRAMANTPPVFPTTHANTGSSGANTGSGGTITASGSPDPLPANVAAALQTLYQEYQSSNYDGGDSDDFTAPSDKTLIISGSNVEVSLKIGSGTDFNAALSQLQSDGMQVGSSSSAYGLIQGMLPIAQLPAAAQIAASVTPVSPPHLS
jgi:hypothetical protein